MQSAPPSNLGTGGTFNNSPAILKYSPAEPLTTMVWVVPQASGFSWEFAEKNEAVLINKFLDKTFFTS